MRSPCVSLRSTSRARQRPRNLATRSRGAEMIMARVRSSAIGLLVGAGAALAAGGCAGTSAVSSAIDPVAEAARASELAPGFKAAISEEITPPGGSEHATASGGGVFDQTDKRAALSVHVKAGEHSFTTKAQYSDLAIYMELPGGHSSSITHGKPWIMYDLRGVGKAMGLSYSALTSSGSSTNPSQFLSYLRATSGAVTRVGTEQVRGVPTTRYRATIEYGRLARVAAPTQRAAAKSSAAALERLTGSATQPVEVWIDAQHRVRREDLTYHECLPGGSGSTAIRMQLEFYDYEIQAIPPLPAKNEVADVTSYVVERLKHTKLGCDQPSATK